MKSILINIIIIDDYSEEKLLNIINKCISSNYKIDINICDYRLKKDDINEPIKDRSNVSVKSLSYEDRGSHDNRLFELLGSESYVALIDLEQSIDPEENFIDQLELETLDDKNFGCIYSDYYSKTKSGHKLHIHQKSFPLVSPSLPLIAFSMENYIKNINEEKVKAVILNTAISKHIPKALCSVSNA